MFCDSMMLGGGRKAAFSIAHSVLMDGANDYFSRTPSVAGNRKIWTFSAWVKRSKIGLSQPVLRVWDGSSPTDDKYLFIAFNPSDKLIVTGNTAWRVSTRLFRDVTSWLHVVVSFNSDASQLRVYVNGEEITTWDTNAALTAGLSSPVNGLYPHYIGDPANPFNGYIAHPILVDGQALAPTAFGETDPVTGSWRPKKPQISDYGTNGFALDFATPTDLGRDVSGKANHWTPVSLGAADVVADSPTNNYAVLNPIATVNGDNVFSNGNLAITAPGYGVYATIAVDEKMMVYAEWTAGVMSSGVQVGVDLISAAPVAGQYPGGTFTSYAYKQTGQKQTNAALSAYGASWTTNDVISILWNGPAGTMTFWKNGVSQGTAFSSIPAGRYWIAVGTAWAATYGGTWNFGQRPFAYTPPTGFKALCTANLSTPSIQSPAKFMDVLTYTGNDTSRSIVGLGFQPDLVWIKSRNDGTAETGRHTLWDSVRGVNQVLCCDRTNAEITSVGLTAFNSDGFSLGVNAGNNFVNKTGNNYVAWCWKAGGAAVTNTAGSITSQVSANPQAGFSVVNVTHGSGAETAGHGLGRAPALIIGKRRNSAGAWPVYHKSAGTGVMYLNTTAAYSSGAGEWNNTAPTSTVMSLGAEAAMSAGTYVFYCWSEIDGFSKFGSYTGNGSTDGPFVYCGFRPRFVLIKRTDSAGTSWLIHDTARDRGNPTLTNLNANDSSTDNSTMPMDVTANGFKIRDSYAGWNASGGTYIFAAFAEAPLGGVKTTPAKAR